MSGDGGVVVLGAGPGGYAAAFLAADLGLAVTLVDPEPNPGGVCLYRGCIPSKTLLHVAGLLEEARAARDWGVSFGEPAIDLERLRAFKDGVVARLTGGLGQLVRQRKIRYVQGLARFGGATTLTVEGAAGERSELAFAHAILASGSRPALPAGFPARSPRVLDSSSALALTDLPRRLLVVGGGYIGLELGSVYAALGSRVTLVEMTPDLLPGVDRDLVRPLGRKLERSFAALRVSTRVVALEERDEAIEAVLEGPQGSERLAFDRVLVAVGRQPNSADLGLERTRVELDERGFVRVDARRGTAEPSIYAIGDVAGQPMLAHKASHEGRVAAESIAGRKSTYEPAAVPAVVFTDPEIAWCGLTEDEAKAAGREVEIARFPWAASGRAASLGRDDGLTKLLIERGSERILGVGIVGPRAGELIAEGVLAVEMAATARDLSLTIHPHPTLSETLMETAEVFFGQATHVHRPRRG